MNGMVNYGILQPNVGNALAAGYQQAEDRRNALMQQQQQRQPGGGLHPGLVAGQKIQWQW